VSNVLTIVSRERDRSIPWSWANERGGGRLRQTRRTWTWKKWTGVALKFSPDEIRLTKKEWVTGRGTGGGGNGKGENWESKQERSHWENYTSSGGRSRPGESFSLSLPPCLLSSYLLLFPWLRRDVNCPRALSSFVKRIKLISRTYARFPSLRSESKRSSGNGKNCTIIFQWALFPAIRFTWRVLI